MGMKRRQALGGLEMLKVMKAAFGRALGVLVTVTALAIPTGAFALSGQCQAINNNQIAIGAGVSAPGTLSGTYTIGSQGFTGEQLSSTNYSDFNQSFAPGEVIHFNWTRNSGTGYVHVTLQEQAGFTLRSGSMENVTGGSGSGSITVGSADDVFNIAVTNYSNSLATGVSNTGEAGRNNSSVTFNISCTGAATPPTVSAAFDASSVNLGGSRQLQITLTNLTSSAMTGVSFAAASLQANLNGSMPSSTCTSATVTYNTGTRAFSLSGGTLAAGASCQASLTVTPTAAGSYTYTTGTVSATGATGGVATTGALVVNVVPTVTSISPTTGPNGGGTSVTVTGTNFTGVSGAGGVKFGATNAPGYTVVNDTTIIATAPAGSAGTVDITVTNSGTTSATSAADQYTYVAPPVSSSQTYGSIITYNEGSNQATNIDLSLYLMGGGVPTSFAVGSTTTAQGGTVSVNSSGLATYTPPMGFRNANDSFTYTATNLGGTSAPATVTVTIGNPTITVALPSSIAMVERAYNAGGSVVSVSGGRENYTINSISGLPSGLTSSGGVISGTPAVNGTFTVTVNLTDSSLGAGPYNANGTATLTVGLPPAPVVSSFAISNLAYNTGTATATSFSAAPHATESPTGYQVGASSYGGSVSVNSSGLMSYTPSVGFRGTDTFNYVATNAGGTSNVGQVFVTVNDPVFSVTLPTSTGAVGQAYNSGGAAVTMTGGKAPYNNFSASGLPAGLTMSSSGVISGTPTAASSGTITITATDSSGGNGNYTSTASAPLTIAVPTIVLSPASGALPGGSVGTGYSQSFTASGGTAGYSYAVTQGSLPPDLILSTGGTLSGTPTGTGTFNFDITATDSSTGGGPYTKTNSYSITITPAALTINAAAASGLQVGANYSQTNSASGGVAPYVYSLNAGALVPGTSLNTATGVVSGTPTIAGSFAYQIRVTDGQTLLALSSIVSVTIAKGNQTVAFATAAPNGAMVGGTYHVTTTASSGLMPTVLIDASAATVCSISGGSVTFLSTGTCVINANQAGDSNWNAASQVQQSFTIGAATAISASVSFSTSSLGVGETGVATITFTNPNASASPSIAPLFIGSSLVSRGALGGSCGASGSDSGANFQFNGFSIPSGACTVTINYAGVTAGSTTGLSLGAFTPSGYPTTSATSSGAFVVVPVVTGISPNSGPASQVVTISGVGFSTTPGNNTVTFGAAGNGNVTAASSHSLTVTAPAAGSGPVAVTVTVNGQTSTTSSAFTFIDRPIAANKSGVAVPYNSTGTAIDLSGSITGGPHSSIAIASAPAHGSMAIAGDVVTYAPAAGYYGADSFTYTATGAGGTSNIATVSIVVGGPAAPVASDKSGVAIPYNDAGTAIDLSGSITGVRSSIAIASAPAHGSVTIAGEVITYKPSAAYYGVDSFTYTAAGPGGVSTPAMVSLTVATPVAPVVTPPTDPVVVPPSQGGSIAIDLGTVSQGVIDGFRIAVTSAYGTTELIESGQAGPASVERSAAPKAAGGVQLIYTPVANFMGTDTVTVLAYGPGGDSAPATFTFQVTGKAPDLTGVIASDAAVRLSPTAGLVGGPFNAVRITRAPAFGTATVDGLDIVFTPGATNSGATSLDYVVDLPFGSSASGRIDLNSNLVPGAQVLTAETLQGVPVTVRISNTAGGPFTGADVVSINPANAGTAVVTGGGAEWNLTFTPDDGFSGQAVVTFSLTNAAGTTNGTLTIAVEARPDPSQNAEVRGVATAQVTSARRFADAQLNNFQRRLQSLHDGSNGSSNGLNLNIGFGSQTDLDKDPRAALRRQLGGRNQVGRGTIDDRSRDMLGLDVWGDRKVESEAASISDDRQGAGPVSGQSGKGAEGGSTVGFWTTGSVDWGHQDAAGQRDYRFSTQGVTAGLDVRVFDRLIVGGGLGYGEDKTKIGDNGTVSKGSALTGALYASWRPAEAFYIDGVVGYADLDFNARRWTEGLGDQPDGYSVSERSGDVRFGSASFGRLLRGRGVTTDLYARMDSREIALDGFTETGGGYGSLSWDKVEQRSLSVNFGAAWRWTVESRRYGRILPRARMEWSHELEDVGMQGVRYADWAASPTYLVPLDAWSRNAINIDLGAEWTLTDQLMFSLGYRSNLGDASVSHGAEIHLKYGW